MVTLELVTLGLKNSPGFHMLKRKLSMLDKSNAEKEVFSAFSYILDEYLFKKVYRNNEYGIHSKGFLLGIESDKCRILFVKESELKHVSFWIGSVVAPFENPDAAGVKGWFNLLVVGHFVSGGRITTKEEYDVLEPLERLKLISNRLHPIIHQVLEVFTDERKIELWMPKFREFVKKEYRKY